MSIEDILPMSGINFYLVEMKKYNHNIFHSHILQKLHRRFWGEVYTDFGEKFIPYTKDYEKTLVSGSGTLGLKFGTVGAQKFAFGGHFGSSKSGTWGAVGRHFWAQFGLEKMEIFNHKLQIFAKTPAELGFRKSEFFSPFSGRQSRFFFPAEVSGSAIFVFLGALLCISFCDFLCWFWHLCVSVFVIFCVGFGTCVYQFL